MTQKMHCYQVHCPQQAQNLKLFDDFKTDACEIFYLWGQHCSLMMINFLPKL